MLKRESKQEKAIKRLNTYIWTGAVYLMGSMIWFIASYFKGELNSPFTFLWLGGSVAYLLGMTRTIKQLNLVKSGYLAPEAIDPDERQEFIADKAANKTFWWTIIILLGTLSGEWGYTKNFPVNIAIILLIVIVLYFTYYIYYLRKY